MILKSFFTSLNACESNDGFTRLITDLFNSNFFSQFSIFFQRLHELLLASEFLVFRNYRGNSEEEFFISFVILSNLVGTNNSDSFFCFKSMILIPKETFFCIVIISKPNVTMIAAKFLLWILVCSFSFKKLNFYNFSKLSKIAFNVLFCQTIWQFVDVDLMVRETVFDEDVFSSDCD